MTSREYIKRVWRVPKDRGALEYFSALLVKALVKHGWPASAIVKNGYIHVSCKGHGLDHPPDFSDAVDVATRIIARTYRVTATHTLGLVQLHGSYRVTSGGFFVLEPPLT